MKIILTFSFLAFFTLVILGRPSASKLQKQKELLKAKTPVCSVGNNIKVDTTSNFSIRINVHQNLVTVATDSLNVKTSETLPNKTNVGNSIEINGQKNAIAISQVNKNNTVAVSQNGNNNTVKISQSNHQPKNIERRLLRFC